MNVKRTLPVLVIFNFSDNSLTQKHWLMKVHTKAVSPEGTLVGRHSVNTKGNKPFMEYYV